MISSQPTDSPLSRFADNPNAWCNYLATVGGHDGCGLSISPGTIFAIQVEDYCDHYDCDFWVYSLCSRIYYDTIKQYF